MAILQSTYLTGSLIASSSTSESVVSRGSGSNILTVDGVSGRLLAINDSFSGSLFSVNTVSGLPILEVFSDNTVRAGQYGLKGLFVSQSFVGIRTETPKTALEVSGSVTVSGSIVATGNLFSKGGSIADYTNGISDNRYYFVWRAPFSCSVTALYGIRDGGSATQVNARRSGSAGYALHTASNLSVGTANLWTTANSVQNTTYVAGDSLEIIISGSGATPNQVAVQVDFVKL